MLRKIPVSTYAPLSPSPTNSIISEQNAPDRYGKHYFVGCSAWHVGDLAIHRNVQIDRDINEDAFVTLFKNKGKMNSDTKLHGLCSIVVHPRSHKQKCCKSHFVIDKLLDSYLIIVARLYPHY